MSDAVLAAIDAELAQLESRAASLRAARAALVGGCSSPSESEEKRQPPVAPQPQPGERLVSLAEAAELSGLAKRTLERMKAAGELPEPVRAGGEGRPALWSWDRLRPVIEPQAKRVLPERRTVECDPIAPDDDTGEWLTRSPQRRQRWEWMKAAGVFTTRDLHEEIGGSENLAHMVLSDFRKRGLICAHTEKGVRGLYHASGTPCPDSTTPRPRESTPEVDAEKAEERDEAPSPRRNGREPAPPINDSATVERLVTENDRLALWMAHKYLGSGEPIEDLAQEARMGLMRAAELWDPERGKFTTYAHQWMRQFLLRHLSTRTGTVRTPEHVKGGGVRAASIDAGRDEGRRALQIPDLGMTVGDQAEQAEAVLRVHEALSQLPDRDRLVLELRYGMRQPAGGVRPRKAGVRGAGCEMGATLEQVGEELGVSRARAQQIQERAMRRFEAAILTRAAGAA